MSGGRRMIKKQILEKSRQATTKSHSAEEGETLVKDQRLRKSQDNSNDTEKNCIYTDISNICTIGTKHTAPDPDIAESQRISAVPELIITKSQRNVYIVLSFMLLTLSKLNIST